MRLSRRTLLAGSAAMLASPALGQGAFPNKPIKIVVPYAPGGASDFSARILSEQMNKKLGQPVLVENRPGASSNIAAEAAIRAPADGYTLFMLGAANTINATLYDKLSFNFIRDVAPVAGIMRIPLIMVVNPSIPARTAAELIGYAKANPGKLNFGSGGVGTSNHLAGELFKSATATDLVHVPYKGTPAAYTDLMSGKIELMWDNIVAATPHLKSGKLKAIAVTSAQRAPSLPDVPTMAESGVPEFEAVSWIGALVPTGTPKDIVDKIHTDLVAVLRMPEVKEQLAQSGAVVVGNTPEQFASWNRNEIAKWSKAVQLSGAKAD